jgi:cytochrome c
MDLGGNKIAFCVLATGLVLIGLQQGAAAFFPSQGGHGGHEAAEHKVWGWNIPVAETNEPQNVVEGPRDYLTMFQAANPQAGAGVATACKQCHSLENNNQTVQGPPLFGVMGRPIASHAGFSYSAALTGKQPAVWDWDHLDHFLENPRRYAPGTAMSYNGVRNPKDRMDLIAYLRTLTTGAPFPEPAPLPPQPAAGETPAPVDGAAPAPGETPAPAGAATSAAPGGVAPATPAPATPAGAVTPSAGAASPRPAAPAPAQSPAPAPH